MPDVPDRDELEVELARIIGRLNGRYRTRIIQLLGDPPNLTNIPESFWRQMEEEMGIPFRAFVIREFLASAERLLKETPIGVDWDLINIAASEWANRYTYEFVTGITNTSRQALQTAISNFFQERQTIGELRERLGQIWGPVRAEMIARTEVTRAAVEGNRAFAAEVEKEGVRMAETWQTRNDELVCPICGPRHGQVEGFNWTKADGPPAHPRCRCWTIFELRAVPA